MGTSLVTKLRLEMMKRRITPIQKTLFESQTLVRFWVRLSPVPLLLLCSDHRNIDQIREEMS